MAIYMSAQWQCFSGSEETVAAALKEFVSSVGQHETGTQMYTALQDVEESTRFMTSIIFKDEAARQFHQSTEWVKRFTDAIYPLAEGNVVFNEYYLVASTG